ncbi:hypothetical protein ACVHYJ_33065 [Burkholderia pyrrocinia]
MRTDPIRPNFYQGTGGYVWQLAEYLQCSQTDASRDYTLIKSIPPQLPNPLATCPESLAPDSSVRWSAATRITHNIPRLIGPRGVRSSLVVVESAQAFGGFRHENAQALEKKTTVGSFSDIEINGVIYDAGMILVTLYRHGFIETNQEFPTSPPVRFMIEPTCTIVDAIGIGRVVVNQFNGRTIRLSEVSQRIFFGDNLLENMPESLHPNIVTFVEAGMLRLLSGGNTCGHD